MNKTLNMFKNLQDKPKDIVNAKRLNEKMNWKMMKFSVQCRNILKDLKITNFSIFLKIVTL